MDNKTGIIGFDFLGFLKHSKNNQSVTLLELILSIVVTAIMLLSFYGLEIYGQQQVLNADRRSKVQNKLTYSLEHMSKYVQQAVGNINGNQAITLYPTAGPKTGFQVRVDFNNPQTPSNFADDAIVYYTLANNTLSTGCTGSCGSFTAEVLNDKVVANFNNSSLPNIPPYGASDGFYVLIGPASSYVDVGLVGRYYPDQVPTVDTKLNNPQVAMRARLICNNSSTN